MTGHPAATTTGTPPDLARYGRRGLLGLGACLLVVAGASALLPDPATPRRYVDVGVGQPAAIPLYRVVVHRVAVARSATDADGYTTLRSTARLVAVTVTADVFRRQSGFVNVWLATADGHRYDPRDELASAGPGITPPGFTADFTLLFELPPSRVAGAVLVFDGHSGTVDVYRDAIRVDLGLTADTPVAAQPVTLPDATTRVTR